MGTDIHGVLEVARREAGGVAWSALDLDALGDVGRNYDIFGCLFGVRNYAGFAPLVPLRGLPDDVAAETRAEWGDGDVGWGETWLTWSDVSGVDWEELALRTDERVQGYVRVTDREAGASSGPEPSPPGAPFEPSPRNPGTREVSVDGEVWRPSSKAQHNSVLAGHVGVEHGPDGSRYPEGTTWQVGEVRYVVRRMRRREAMAEDPAWQAVLERLRDLAAVHGEESVRLVVWFDS